MKILIADDSVVSRHLLEAALRRWGYDVAGVGDGGAAWRLLQRDDAPSIAILDWMMPEMTGPEVCRLVRQSGREPYTYVLLLTSRSQREDLIEGMEAGADDYITKPFDEHELKVRLRAATRIMELQTELLRTREALRDEAMRDSLTRLWNRASILEVLQRELARSLRERCPLGVLMIDLDHFKRINDTWGHVVGDAVLVEASRRMQADMREYDTIGRYGGEEFLVTLPGCDERNTIVQANRMCAQLASNPFSAQENVISLSGSFGATSVPPGVSVAAESIIRHADKALYRAKEMGRNRVEFLPLDIEDLSQTTSLLRTAPR